MHIFVFGTLFIVLDVEQVVQWMVEEDVSLQNFVAVKKSPAFSKRLQSVVVDCLSVEGRHLAGEALLVVDLVDEDPLQETHKRKLRRLLEPLAFKICWSSAPFQNLIEVVGVALEADDAEPVEELDTSSNVDVFQELLIIVSVLDLRGHWQGRVENHCVQNGAHRILEDLNSILIIEAYVLLHGLGELCEGNDRGVLVCALIFEQLVALVLHEWNLRHPVAASLLALFKHEQLGTCTSSDDDLCATNLVGAVQERNDLNIVLIFWLEELLRV